MGGASRFIMLLTTTPFPRPVPSFLFRLTGLSLSAIHCRRLSASPAPTSLLLHPIKCSHQQKQQAHFHANSSAVNDTHFASDPSRASPNPYPTSHPWPQWSHLVDALAARGYFNRNLTLVAEDEFVGYEELPTDFVPTARACLAFARERPDLLGSLSRRDIEVVVRNGTPYIFRSVLDSARRMRSFLGGGGSNVSESDKPQTVDLMKYLLSYASSPSASSERNSLYSRELIELSVCNLLVELAIASSGGSISSISSPAKNQFSGGYGQVPRPLGQNIPMKRGDWICPKCSFMNFARNSRCLECDEPRPKRQLTGGEWECPQCDFLNYRRNMVCLRCDCKRPGEALSNSINTISGLAYNGNHANNADLESKLAANEEKAQRWFSKVSQMSNSSDMSALAADEDFPEIMPLRKGENRFVVSTRKTPLERRLANSQYQKNQLNDSQTGIANKMVDSSIHQGVDHILGHTSTVAGGINNITSGQNAGTDGSSQHTGSGLMQYGPPKGGNSNCVPFFPLPADTFANKLQNSEMESDKVAEISVASVANNEIATQSESQDMEKEQAKKSETWLRKIEELHNAEDLPGAISGDDFPEIMPMQKGENQFVVSKKDHSLTSPFYKRQMAMEQGSSTNFIPFVPFPPDYFSKKDKQQPDAPESVVTSADASSPISLKPYSLGSSQHLERMENQQPNWNSPNSGAYGAPTGKNTTQTSFISQNASDDSWNSRYSRIENPSQTTSGNWNPQSLGDNGIPNNANPAQNPFHSQTISKDSRNTGCPMSDNPYQAISGNWNSQSSVAYRAPSNSGPTQNSFHSQTTSKDSWNTGYPRIKNQSQTNSGNWDSQSLGAYGAPYNANPTQNSSHSQTTGNNSWNPGYSRNENTSQNPDSAASSSQPPENQNIRSGWTGKSLEGSAVKEPDPLDMSEEAKAERWFRRVAQIKDISELSQIPDEDFPSIMPMRKGVNRFVVSKRKTPLERRLTSQQYRRNLPIVRSDPLKKENENN